MEATTKNQSHTSTPTAAKMAVDTAADVGQKITDKMSNAAQAVREKVEKVEDRGAEIIDQAKQKASEVYDQASKSVSEQYEKAVDYGRENPGKTTLIAFGAGVGVGLLLLSSFSGSRRRGNRVAKPVIKALATFAREMFR